MFDRLSIPEQISDLRAVSDSVVNYLDSDGFKEDLGEEDYDLNDLLSRCYELVADELQEFGISFSVPIADILESWYTAKMICVLRELVDANTLKILLLPKEKRNNIDTLIHSDEFGVSSFDDFLTVLNNEKYNSLKDYSSWVLLNTKFMDHVAAVIKTVNESNAAPAIDDLKAVERYMKLIQANRELLTHFKDLIFGNDYDIGASCDIQKLNLLIGRYDQDKLATENISIYAKVDIPNCPEQLQEIKKEYLDAHHLRASHHIEYWDNKFPYKVPSLEDVILLVLHFIENGYSESGEIYRVTTEQEFLSKVNDMIEKHQRMFDTDLLRIDDKPISATEIIRRIVKIVIDYGYRE